MDATPLSCNGALEETKFFEANDAVFFCGATAGAATGSPLEDVVFLRGMKAVSGTAGVSFALDPVLAVECFILLDCNVLATSLRLVSEAAVTRDGTLLLLRTMITSSIHTSTRRCSLCMF